MEENDTLDVLIVGAGPGGIATAIMLREKGIENVLVLERSAGIGGTWFNNRYPGLACDIASDHYCFSFFQDYDWTRAYPRPAEFREYLDMVTKEFGVAARILTDTGVTSATWHDDGCVWEVTDTTGAVRRCRALVGAVGMFNELVRPEIAGLDEFAGPIVHTAEWPMEGGESLVSGRSVAVIGSAASAIQLIPTVAPVATHLDVYQRTANWVFPKNDEVYDDEARAARRFDPAITRQARDASVSLVNTLGDFNNEELMAGLREQAMENLAKVKDPDLRERLAPRLPIGAQRPLLSSEYYETFNRPNVDLVTDPIREITAEGIVTEDGKLHPADIIVLATGYAAHKFFSVVDVIGREGVALRDLWRDGAYAYLGITVEHFPNMFMLYGPNTNGGSILDKLETQARYITGKIAYLLAEGIDALEVKPDVVATYNERLQEELKKMDAWQVEGSRYYRAPGGRIVTQCPYSPTMYDEMTRTDDLEAFRVRVRTA